MGATITIHKQLTRRSSYSYAFTPKHHGGGLPTVARWHPNVSRQDEFDVFDTADFHNLSDQRGWLYGFLVDQQNRFLAIGTLFQQIAEFPKSRLNQPWHGYPIWPIKKHSGPFGRRSQKMRPDKTVFQQMLTKQLISPPQMRLLQRGDFL